MAQRRAWTNDDLTTLRSLWGDYTVPQIARRLNRSPNAVKIKAIRLGLGGQTDSGSLMTARKVAELMGVDLHTVTDYWIKGLGLKAKKRGNVYSKKIHTY